MISVLDTAELLPVLTSGDAVVVDAAFDHAERRSALRASMRSDWYMPVH